MGWDVFADDYMTAEMTNTSKFQKASFSQDTYLKACRIWLVFNGSPVFTSLSMKIYSDNSGVPGTLLYTSSSRLASVYTQFYPYGFCETWFEFGESVPLKGGDNYHFVINGVNYVGTANSCIAWMKAYPDPVYTTGLTVDTNHLSTFPYRITFIDAGKLP